MIAGDSKVQFYRALRRAGVRPDRMPTVSFGTVEHELRSLVAHDVAGDYTAWNYFQNIDRPENHEFVRRFQERYGLHRMTSDPVAAAYAGVNLWAQAVQTVGSEDVGAIRLALGGQSFEAPEGLVRIDPHNQHAWRTARLGRFSTDGRIEIIWTSQEPIAPVPYPPSRSRAAWDAWLQGLSQEWGGQWVNPGSRER
jgi:urea transport system substrate-binding protein